MKIYIEGLGYRNALTEKQEIIWFLQQVKKRKKFNKTRYFASIKQAYHKQLLEIEAFDIIAIIESAVSVKPKKLESKKRIIEDAKLLLNHSRTSRYLLSLKIHKN